LELAPFQALEKDVEHAPLFELLQIFLTKTADAYLAWEKTHGALLKKLGKLSGRLPLLPQLANVGMALFSCL
jgi:hypothetical protein